MPKSFVGDNDSNRMFWGELAPGEHLVTFYEVESEFYDVLEKFVLDGFRAGEAVVIIATPAHLAGLEGRLWTRHFDLIADARSRDRYIALEADATLSKFMVNNWPDEKLFQNEVSAVLARALMRAPKARAFGEMVALLWSRGLAGATVRLEHLWNRLIETHGFPLLCAYPKTGFTKDAAQSMREICQAHTKTFGCSHETRAKPPRQSSSAA